MEPAPAVGEKVGVPQPVVDALGVGAMTIVAGNVSAKFTPVMLEVPGFVIRMFIVEVAPGTMASATNVLLMPTPDAERT